MNEQSQFVAFPTKAVAQAIAIAPAPSQVSINHSEKHLAGDRIQVHDALREARLKMAAQVSRGRKGRALHEIGIGIERARLDLPKRWAVCQLAPGATTNPEHRKFVFLPPVVAEQAPGSAVHAQN